MSKLISDFSADSVTFSEIKKTARGGKYILLSDSGREMYIQFPSLNAPFGISEPNDQAKEYSLNLSLTDEVIDKLRELEEKVLVHVSENSKELFGKTVDKSVLEDMLFNPIIKKAKDDKYAPTMKLKVSSGEGKYVADFYKNSTEKVPISDIKKGSKIESIVRVGQVWFIGGKFGISLKLEQAKVHMNSKISGYAFKDDEDDQIDIPDDVSN